MGEKNFLSVALQNIPMNIKPLSMESLQGLDRCQSNIKRFTPMDFKIYETVSASNP